MIGVNVRGSNGSTMNDLPNIIKQIYNLLKNSAGKVTPEYIAVSAMSGNALDSILDPSFGQDQEVRGTVLAGILQMAQSGGASLYTSGSKSALQGTGALTRTINALSTRNQSELRMLQAYTPVTNVGINDMNETLLPATYDRLTHLQGLYAPLQASYTGLQVFNASRGGAGSAMTDALFGGAGLTLGGLKGSGTAGSIAKSVLKRLGVGGIAAGAGIAGGLAGLAGSLHANAASGGVVDVSDSSLPTGTVQAAPVFTGAITVNVTAPPGSDPYTWASSITNAMTNAARS
jgi:hypothetical protein